MKRIAAVAVATIAVGGYLAGTASAYQGEEYYNNAGLTVNGTRSGVQRLVLTPASNSLAFVFVKIISSVGSGLPKGMQVGYTKQGTNITTDCGGFSGLKTIVEYSADGTNYFCDPYTTTDNNQRLAVVKESCCVGLWGAFVDGVQLEMDYIVISTGYAAAGGEYLQGSNTVSGCWGCSGANAWQYTTSNGSSYTNVPSPSGEFNDLNVWTIGDAPSPFQIHN